MNTRQAAASLGIITAVLVVFSCLFTSEASTASQKLTIGITQASGGRISASPAGKKNQVRVQAGRKVVFTVKPDKGRHVTDILTSAGSVFSQAQKIGDSKIYRYTIPSVSAADTITATFAKDSFTLTVSITGEGAVSATGLTCGSSTCSGTYDYGDQVALTAAATGGSVLKSWSGCKTGKPDKTVCTARILKEQAVKVAFKAVSGSVAVRMKADFSSSSAGRPLRAVDAVGKQTSCTGAAAAMDGPDYAAGLDCDQDGGVIQYITPQSFKIALKRLTFVNDNGDRLDFVQDLGMLSKSLIYDLTSQVTISEMKIPAGNYNAIEAEMYYYEIKMPLNNPQAAQSVRVYLSDDDFPAEGSLGHHQGDITLIDDDGNELGWVGVAAPWVTSALQTDKSKINRPGSIDSETGHQRGLFGDAALWGQSAFAQGGDRDIYLLSSPLDLAVSNDAKKTVTFTFNLKDTWFWEDFDEDGRFNPCENSAKDACASNAEWAPIFNMPVLSTK